MNRYALLSSLTLPALLLSQAPAHAANVITDSAFTTVNVDGNTNFSGGQAVSVVQQGGTYHMWFRNSNYPDPAFGTIGDMTYATSTDGVSFSSVGNASFSNNPFPTGTAPALYYENVSVVGGDFIVQHFTYNGGAGDYAAYNYNLSTSNAGSIPSTSMVHQGTISPQGNGVGGNVSSTFGIVGGNLYTSPGARTLTRGAYVSNGIASQTQVADFQTLFDNLGISNGYINNHSDVVDIGDGSGTNLGFYFTVRENSGARLDEQVYFSESTDGGATWSAATGTLTAPTLDGGAFGGNFAHADVIGLEDGSYGLYVGSQDAGGGYIIATTVPEPGSIALLGLGGLALIRRRRRA